MTKYLYNDDYSDLFIIYHNNPPHLSYLWRTKSVIQQPAEWRQTLVDNFEPSHPV